MYLSQSLKGKKNVIRLEGNPHPSCFWSALGKSHAFHIFLFAGLLRQKRV